MACIRALAQHPNTPTSLQTPAITHHACAPQHSTALDSIPKTARCPGTHQCVCPWSPLLCTYTARSTRTSDCEAHVFIKFLPSLWPRLINTHVVIQCTSMHAVPMDTWCLRTLPAAHMRSLTPLHLHVLDIINHSISWYLYLNLTMARLRACTLSCRHLAHKHMHCII